MGGHRNSYGKRHSDYSDNGGGSKRRNHGDERERDRERDRDRDSYAPGPDDTVYRYLCPGRKIGSIIGRGGEIAKQLRSDTHAKIRIGESVPGSDERVITIFSSSRETNTISETGERVCPAQDALFRVHDKLADDDVAGGEDGEAGLVTVRLLIPSDQIGCIIGKGGQIIQDIRSDTGAQVRILKNDNLPPCAISSDELLQIVGDASVVKKALTQVSARLHDNPSRSNHLLTWQPQPVSLGPIVSPYGRDGGREWVPPPPYYPPHRDESSGPREFTLRMLCASSLIGAVIGKGGGIINQIRQESGASVKVDSSTGETDCIITISSKEYFEDPISPTIDAAVRLQPRCGEKADPDSNADPTYTTRLLVPSSRIGCLIGKGGGIITEMRRSTRANIRILSKDSLPKVASLEDEMVQISGELDIARNALIQVATRLKANFFERENELPTFLPPPPPIPYNPSSLRSNSPELPPRYSGRDKYDRGYSSYSGRYGSDLPSSENFSRYDGSQGGGSYEPYSRYSGRSGSSGPGSLGKYHY